MGIKINDHGFIYAVHMLEKKLKQTEKQPYTFITLSLPEVINKYLLPIAPMHYPQQTGYENTQMYQIEVGILI